MRIFRYASGAGREIKEYNSQHMCYSPDVSIWLKAVNDWMKNEKESV